MWLWIGRLLVGLRWWSIDREDGSIEYIFESLEGMKVMHLSSLYIYMFSDNAILMCSLCVCFLDISELSTLDSRVFWGALYASPICWALLFVVGLSLSIFPSLSSHFSLLSSHFSLSLLVVGLLRLQIEFLPIVAAAILMSTANIIG